MPRHKEPAPEELLSFPARLQYARSRQKMTLTALSKATDIAMSTLSRYESGDRAEGIEAATVIRLARALGVPVGWLAADEGQLPPVPVFREDTDRRRKPRG